MSTGDLLRYLQESGDRDDDRHQLQMLNEDRWRHKRAEREAERRESEDAWRREVRERELRREAEQGRREAEQGRREAEQCRRDARIDDLLAALLHATTGRIVPAPKLESEEEAETPVVTSPRLPTVVPHYPSASTPRLTAAPPDVPETVRFAASTGLERAAVLIDRRNEEVGAQMARAALEEREYARERPGEPARSRTTPPPPVLHASVSSRVTTTGTSHDRSHSTPSDHTRSRNASSVMSMGGGGTASPNRKYRFLLCLLAIN